MKKNSSVRFEILKPTVQESTGSSTVCKQWADLEQQQITFPVCINFQIIFGLGQL